MNNAIAPDEDLVAASQASLYRRRFLAPLLAGRTEVVVSAKLPVPQHPTLSSISPNLQIAVQWEPTPTTETAARAVAMLDLVGPEGVVAIASDGPLSAQRLRQVAPHSLHYVQRPISGALFSQQAFEHGRIAVLHDADKSHPFVHLYLFSNARLPALDPGLLENTQFLPDESISSIRFEADRVATDQLPTARGNAAALAGRLLAQETRLLKLWSEKETLRRTGIGSGSAGGSWFTPPMADHPWPLVQAEDRAPSGDPYDVRVDDPVILAARAGRAFFAANRLESEAPDFGAAVECLTRSRNRLAAPEGNDPDVSIVIPIYGQLAYTLNCLDSLFAHITHYSAEIIIVDDCSPDESGRYLPELPQIRYHRQAVNGGFIESCNTGGQLARGHFVLMLNNDTRVVAGWLDALIDSFTLFPRAGLVGSKMLYADGTLQEAGGIIWRDGSAWNYGRNGDPNRPHCSYARQVDYISGCSIALRRADWLHLGGFDHHFRPAYCEDADLCLRVAQSGAEVWFQPQSRVVHYEGKTSGTDTKTGVKAYQVVNSKKLFLRWRESLLSHRPNAEAPFLEMDRKARQRILVIDATTPTPDQDAGSLQTALALQSCRALGYATSFVPEDNFLFQPRYTESLLAAGIACAYAPYDLGLETYLRIYGRLFDAVLVYRVTVLSKILPLIRQHVPAAVVLFHVADLHFLRMRREAELTGEALMAEEADQMEQRELALVRETDCTITHSHFEAEVLARLVPEAPVLVWPLMFAHQGTQADFASRRDVVFLGGYRHHPNVDAVEHFVADIFPLLRSAQPDLRFIVAGANPTPAVRALAGEAVEVTGLVEDLRDVLDRARVFVCPLRVGAGVKGKVMSALAYGIPIVSTAVGVEGTELVPEEHFLLASGPEDFARQILRLYHDPDLWERLSLAGQALIRETYSPEGGAPYLAQAIEAAWHHKLGVAT
jgi:GT2 family glycosyltransferase/glycosyltransferase involved in cell wall biosynthesis